MTGLGPEVVTDIYYYGDTNHFFGTVQLYLRFTYPDERWIQHYLSDFKIPVWITMKGPFDSVAFTPTSYELHTAGGLRFRCVGSELVELPDSMEYPLML